jgi:hypothetical protein
VGEMNIFITDDDMCTTQKLNLAKVQKWLIANGCEVVENPDQSDKIFLLWDCSNFHIQKIDVNLIQILKIKDISVIEVQKKMYFDLSLANFDYDLRIRINWGNNACVANPRWKFTFINK